MKLLTKELERKIPARYTQENNPDPVVHCKLFCPWNNWTWYVLEYDREEGLFFAYVVGFEKELGYVSLQELESIRHRSGLKIERDLYFTPAPLSHIKKKHGDN